MVMVKYTRKSRGWSTRTAGEGSCLMWIEIYALFGLVYVPISYAALLFGVPSRVLFPASTLCNVR